MDRHALPLVSVIITCYNQARFLRESIESVLRQTHPRHEIIVVDDGSADHPEAIVACFPTVRLIQQANQGVAAARNAGWRASSGAFVVFLDADDRLLPHALQTGYRCFQADPHHGFVFGHGRLIDAGGAELLPNYLPVVPEAGGYAGLLQRNPIAFPALVTFRRSAVESVGGFRASVSGTSIDNASDYDLYLRIARTFPIRSHLETVAEWRQHGANTSRRSTSMLQSTVAVLKGQPVTAQRGLRGARRRGLRRVRSFYGEQLIAELRAEARAGQLNWHRFIAAMLTLAWHYPEGLIANVRRKAWRMVFHRSRADAAE